MRPQPLMPVQLKSGRPVNAGRDAQQIGLLVKGHRGRIAQYRQVLTRGQLRKVGFTHETFAEMQCIGDLDHPRLRRFDEPHCLQCRRDDFAICLKRNRNHGGGRMESRDAIDRRDLSVDRINRPLVRKLRQTNPRSIAVSFLRQPTNKNAPAAGDIPIGRGMVVKLAADHIGIHPRATQVLANLINDQEIRGNKRKSR